MFQFPSLALLTYVFSQGYYRFTCSGFPHSDISGSQLVCSSPKLIAAYHVLHRRLTPRHPPSALSSLIQVKLQKVLHALLTRYAIVKERCWRCQTNSVLVEITGIEPVTSGLQSRRSPN